MQVASKISQECSWDVRISRPFPVSPSGKQVPLQTTQTCSLGVSKSRLWISAIGTFPHRLFALICFPVLSRFLRLRFPEPSLFLILVSHQFPPEMTLLAYGLLATLHTLLHNLRRSILVTVTVTLILLVMYSFLSLVLPSLMPQPLQQTARRQTRNLHPLQTFLPLLRESLQMHLGLVYRFSPRSLRRQQMLAHS